MKFIRWLPIIIPFLILLLFQAYFFYPKYVYIVIILVNLLIFFVFWQFSQASQVDKRWWNYLILPSLMTTIIIVYTLFLQDKKIIQLLFAINIILLYFYFRYVYYYLIKPLAYTVFSIENISSYVNFITFFFLASTCYALQSFLGVSIWLLEIFILILTTLNFYQILWVNKIDYRQALPFILIGCLIIVELSWSIYFLPINYNIAGLSIALCYYILVGLIKNYLINQLDQGKIKIYLSLGLLCLFIVLFTARWM